VVVRTVPDDLAGSDEVVDDVDGVEVGAGVTVDVVEAAAPVVVELDGRVVVDRAAAEVVLVVDVVSTVAPGSSS
jgi:hypothetical protein